MPTFASNTAFQDLEMVARFSVIGMTDILRNMTIDISEKQ